uniref:F-box domain-containing protein n=1 Tax=Pithovirus LCPAC401 TaxID=2506595 RepID=A0A481ZBV8_9VIRU|nr:MAG: uncharacterized protein LCPAC401_01970 [Pithovirus LCPAC401]
MPVFVTIFLDSIELSRIARVSHYFNSISNDEIIRKCLVLAHFGVVVKCCDTWLETSIVLNEDNMINLDSKWINSMTYKEIMIKAYNIPESRHFHKVRYLRELQEKYYPCKEAREGHYWTSIYNKDLMNEIEETYVKRKLIQEELDAFKRVFTREFLVMYYSVFMCEKIKSLKLFNQLRFFSSLNDRVLRSTTVDFF